MRTTRSPARRSRTSSPFTAKPFAKEHGREIPDSKRIEAMQRQILTLAKERDALTPDNAGKVSAAMVRYSLVVRQHLEREDCDVHPEN